MDKYLFQYRRVSSSKQLKGGGLEQQTLTDININKLCSEYDLKPYPEVFEDKAVSGFHISAQDRPSFSRLLTLIESGNVHPDSVLVLSNIDRLGREDIHTAASTLLRVTTSCRLYMTHDQRLFDKSNPNLLVDLIMTLAAMQRAHEESLTKSIRSKQAINQAIKQHINGVRGANGYPLALPCGMLPYWVDSIKGEVITNQRLKLVVRAICLKLIAGESINSVFKWLVENHEPPKQRQWNIETVRKMHYNRSLIGEYSIKSGDQVTTILDYVEPILTKTEFYQLVDARSKHNRNTGKSENVFVFTGYGVSSCRCCGGYMTSSLSQGRERIRCANIIHRRNDCDNPVQLEGSNLLEIMNKQVLSVIGSEALTNPVDKVRYKELKTSLDVIDKAIDKMKQQYLDTQADFIIEMITDKQAEHKAITSELTGLESSRSLESFNPVTSIPEDRKELREAYRKLIRSIKFHRIGKGKVLVSVYSYHDVNMSLYIHYGKLKKIGNLTGSFKGDLVLEDNEKFLEWARTNLDQWIQKSLN